MSMPQELRLILKTAADWQKAGKKTVLATVVKLEGSSYRRPGVRMLLNEAGEAVGAVSGGCVEKEILHQAQSVFRSGKAKIITYDGRYRVGCDGLLYILLESFEISEKLLKAFEGNYKERKPIKAETYYYPEPGEYEGIGSRLVLDVETFPVNPAFQADPSEDQACFSQVYPPVFQLYIFGAEHDAVQLCKAASQLGWEVTIVASPDEAKSIDYFPGALRLISPAFDRIDTSVLDRQTAVVVMSHSLNKDVRYLIALKEVKPAYFGLLGPVHRRERILSEFLNYCPDTSPGFLDQLHGPAGINIGAESASEIAVSILAEILSVIRKQTPMALREKTGSIHG
jgi:xanthine/CO dehydrogenase XdhC/CoxF family maturation factor